MPLEELARPFARHRCEHLKLVDKQTTSKSNKALDACRAFNRGETSEEALAATTTRLGFVSVIDAFHVVGRGPVTVRFFEDERKGNRDGGEGIRRYDLCSWTVVHTTTLLSATDIADQARWAG